MFNSAPKKREQPAEREDLAVKEKEDSPFHCSAFKRGQSPGHVGKDGNVIPQGQPRGSDFPQGQPRGSDFPQGKPRGSDFPQGQPSGEDFPQGQPSGEDFPTEARRYTRRGFSYRYLNLSSGGEFEQSEGASSAQGRQENANDHLGTSRKRQRLDSHNSSTSNKNENACPGKESGLGRYCIL